MNVDEDFSQLLGTLYEGPLQQPPWQTFLASVRELLGAGLVTLLLRPPSEEHQAVMLADGAYHCLEQQAYVDRVCDVLERLPAGMVIHRLTGDPHPDELVAPRWSTRKQETLTAIQDTLAARDTWQGKYCPAG